MIRQCVVIAAILAIYFGCSKTTFDRETNQESVKAPKASRNLQEEKSSHEMIESYKALCEFIALSVEVQKRKEKTYRANGAGVDLGMILDFKETKATTSTAFAAIKEFRAHILDRIDKMGALGYEQSMRDTKAKFDVVDADCPKEEGD